MSGVILSIDIGTSSLKAAFIGFDGRLLAFSRSAYRLGGPSSCWEDAFRRALTELREQSPGSLIDALCVSGNGPTLVPLGRGGEALQPLYWYDGRTLNKAAASFFLPRADWLKENSPQEYESVSLFLSSHEWLSHRLGAEPYTALPQPAYEPYYWDDEQCRSFGIDRGKFPPFAKMGSPVGKVSAVAARSHAASGLKSGTPIIAGGPDFITALIGTRAMEDGDTCDRAGSSEGINYCAHTEQPCLNGLEGNTAKDLRVLPHAMEGLWNIGALIPSSGRLFDWFRNSTGQECRPYDELLAELIPSPHDTELFRDVELISLSSLPDAAMPLSTPDRGRAVLCAIGLSVRAAVQDLNRLGFPVKEMRVSGGQGKNPLWNQLKADISGVSLLIPEIRDGELAGNAALAAAALGAASGIQEAADGMIRFTERCEAKAETAAFWEEKFNLFFEKCSREAQREAEK